MTTPCRLLEYSKFSLFSLLFTYLKILVKANDTGWGERQWQKVWQREPEPELGEDQNPHHRRHVCMSCPRLQWNGYIMAPCKEYESQWVINSWVLHKDTWAMNVKHLLSKACTGHSAASFLLWNMLPSFIVSSAYSVKQMYSTATTLLYSTQTIREYSPSMIILPGYRLDKSTGSERERKRQTFTINSFKTWHINDPQDKAQEEHSTYTAEHTETFLSVTVSLIYQLFGRNMTRFLSYTISVEKKKVNSSNFRSCF